MIVGFPVSGKTFATVAPLLVVYAPCDGDAGRSTGVRFWAIRVVP